MNRPIKFRAWDGEQMLSWAELDHLDREGILLIVELLNGKEKNCVPMQSTGLHDKNGKEIYEFDIVSREGGIFEVQFDFAGWSFTTTPSSPSISYPSFYGNAKHMTVIGNRWENPGLLK